MYSLPALERQLVVYISAESFTSPFDLTVVPVITKEEADAQTLRALTEMTPGPTITAEKPKAAIQPSVSIESTSQKYSKTLSEIPEFKEFGAVLKSSVKPIELTEKEIEYSVSALKHIFSEHIVVQVYVDICESDNSLI
jgi:coatomer subunit gamma